MPSMKRRCLATLAMLLALAGTLGLVQGAQPKFFPDDPIWQEPISKNVTSAKRYEPDLVYQTLVNLFTNPGDPVYGQRAQNVNTVDEVPDGPFFVNRAGRMPLTPEIVARASNTTNGVAPGRWRVISAKSDGVTPGFTIRDSRDDMWFIKFDPPGHPAMASGTEVVSAKLFWALGYHTVEYDIERLVPANLEIAGDAKITPPGQAERKLVQSDIQWLLKKADRSEDGSYRVIASKAAPGRPVGRIRFEGTRADDPNDVVPHEHHRELRGYMVFASWLNHVDAKGINSLVALVTENGKTFLRQYLLDFGSTLGSGGIGPTEMWEGREALVESGRDIALRTAAFGFLIPEWRTMKFYEAPSVGRLPDNSSDWDPDSWRPHILNGAFRHARPDDRFWAAYKMSFITDAMIDAVIREGKFNDPPSEKVLARMIRDRRDRILHAYLPAVNPIVGPALSASGELTFRNAAVDAGVSQAPKGYRAAWSAFDNNTSSATAIAVTESAATTVRAPALGNPAFVKVEISATADAPAAWTQPVAVYFRRAADGWSLVGFERLPDMIQMAPLK